METQPQRQDHSPSISQLIKPGDIVQVVRRGWNFDGCLATVEEVRTWGIQGYIQLPQGEHIGVAYMKDTMRAYVRLAWDQIVATGGSDRRFTNPETQPETET